MAHSTVIGKIALFSIFLWPVLGFANENQGDEVAYAPIPILSTTEVEKDPVAKNRRNRISLGIGPGIRMIDSVDTINLGAANFNTKINFQSRFSWEHLRTKKVGFHFDLAFGAGAFQQSAAGKRISNDSYTENSLLMGVFYYWTHRHRSKFFAFNGNGYFFPKTVNATTIMLDQVRIWGLGISHEMNFWEMEKSRFWFDFGLSFLFGKNSDWFKVHDGWRVRPAISWKEKALFLPFWAEIFYSRDFHSASVSKQGKVDLGFIVGVSRYF